MQVRRSLTHAPEGGWSSVALHLAPADGGKEGFYLTLFPDARPQSVVFLSPRQMQQLLDLSQDSAHSDQAVWDFVARIPLEPMLPSRTLAVRLRWLLADCAAAIREQVRQQLERRPPPSEPLPNDEEEPAPDATEPEAPPASKPPWQIS
jgi:hypothetical protein